MFFFEKKNQKTFIRLKHVCAIAAGGLLLAWPALLNGYPIVFSDTHAFLVMGGDGVIRKGCKGYGFVASGHCQEGGDKV